MARIIIHNTMGARNLGRFRATAPVRDRKTTDCDCGCGGAGKCGDHGHRHARDSQAQAELGVDVTYTKGDKTETRHYNVPKVSVDAQGSSANPKAITDLLRQNQDHVGMLRDGWKAKRAEGYFKREARELGDKINQR